MYTMSQNAITVQIYQPTLYFAFRAAWLSAFHALVHDVARRPEPTDGFFRHIPLLQGTAPQVQLECLFECWTRMQQNNFHATTLDQLILSAAVEELAWLGQIEHLRRLREVEKGPAETPAIDVLWVCSKIRSLQIVLPVRGDRSGIGVNVNTADSLDQSTQPVGDDSVLETVGRWRVSPDFVDAAEGLLTEEEMEKLRLALAEQPGMLNL